MRSPLRPIPSQWACPIATPPLVLALLLGGALGGGVGCARKTSDRPAGAATRPSLEPAPSPRLTTLVDDWRDELVYQVLTDRFADGDATNDQGVHPGDLKRYQGGDWKGIEDHLEYVEALGATALWISPIVRNVDRDSGSDGYHGYWSQDLTRVNAHFGDVAALRSLVAAAHRRRIKVIVDIVVNHMGQLFFYDVNENGRPDVFEQAAGPGQRGRTINEYDPDFDARGVRTLGGAPAPIVFLTDREAHRETPVPAALARPEAYHRMGRMRDLSRADERSKGDFLGGLKDLVTEDADVQRALVDVYARWVEDLDLDGYRIDTVKHVDHGFFRAFARGLRDRITPAGKRNFLLLGEVNDGDPALVGSYTAAGELDSVFDFPQTFAIFDGLFARAHDAAPSASRATSRIEALWKGRDGHYGASPQDRGIGVAPARALVNFVDNHDMPRFLASSKADGDVAALRNALTLVMTEEGIPCVYYGTEADLRGGEDPDNREVFWPAGFAKGDPTVTGSTAGHLARLARLRKAYPALRRGATKVRYATSHVGAEPDAGLFAFERTGGLAPSDYALVVLNTSGAKASAPAGGSLTVGAPPGSALIDVLAGDPASEGPSYTVDGTGRIPITVPAQGARILVPAAQLRTPGAPAREPLRR